MRGNQTAQRPKVSYKLQNQLRMFLDEILRAKYADSFNFYLTKTVNQIIEEMKTSEEIIYYDYLVYDDRQEIMRRFYSHSETGVRLRNYTQYYAGLSEYQRPCYEKLNKRRIMEKRRKRLTKFVQRKEVLKRPEGEADSGSGTDGSKAKLLKNLQHQTLYLEDIDLKAAVESNAKVRQKAESATKTITSKEQMLLQKDCQVHDIYDPIFTSEEEAESHIAGESAVSLQLSGCPNIVSTNAKLNISIEDKITEIDAANESKIMRETMTQNLFTRQSLAENLQVSQGFLTPEISSIFQIRESVPKQSSISNVNSHRSLRVNFTKDKKAEVVQIGAFEDTLKCIELQAGLAQTLLNSGSEVSQVESQTLLNSLEKARLPATVNSKLRSKLKVKVLTVGAEHSHSRSAKRLSKRQQDSPVSKQGVKFKKNFKRPTAEEPSVLRIRQEHKTFQKLPDLILQHEMPKPNILAQKLSRDRNVSTSSIMKPKGRFKKGCFPGLLCSPTQITATHDFEIKTNKNANQILRSPLNRQQKTPVNLKVTMDLKNLSNIKFSSPKLKLPETFRGIDNFIQTINQLQSSKVLNKENSSRMRGNRFEFASPKMSLPKSPSQQKDPTLALAISQTSAFTGMQCLPQKTPKISRKMVVTADGLKRQAKSVKINLNPKQLVVNLKGSKGKIPFFNSPINFQQIICKQSIKRPDFKFMTMAPSGLFRSKHMGSELLANMNSEETNGPFYPGSVKNLINKALRPTTPIAQKADEKRDVCLSKVLMRPFAGLRQKTSGNLRLLSGHKQMT